MALAALALLHQSADAKVLTIGDPAPAISVKKFVKGAPVVKLEKGKIYVVDLWATWCVICKSNIPRLTALQKRYKDVTFIGVSIWEESQSKVAPFVKSMGDKMNYRVAMDVVPGWQGWACRGVMANAWLEAAKQPGIPMCFIVDKNSRIAWMGHPLGLDEALSKVVAGTWDIKAAAADAAREKAKKEKIDDLKIAISPAMEKKDYASALGILDKAIAASPDIELSVGGFRFSILMNLHRDAEAFAYGSNLVDGPLHNRADDLSDFAWVLVSPRNPKASPPVAELALKAATRADELAKGTDSSIADTLATAYFAAGKKELAISTEQRAIKNSTDDEMTATEKTSLETFKK